jgi:CubicO group peptidase (beta-lactamase class C family)
MHSRTATVSAGPASDDAEASLAQVERLFHDQLSPLRLFPGGALAVYVGGKLALDLVGGYADTQRAELVRPDSLFPLFSGTKPFAAVALWQLIERGLLDLDEPVVAHWPAFGRNGKDRVLIRHVLSHRGGFPTTPRELTPERWGEHESVIRAIEAMPLEFPAGSTSAYHFLTQHWVCAELIRRVDGREFGAYVRAEIFEPLRLRDTFIGLPASEEHRLVRLHATDGTDDWGREMLRLMDGLRLHRMVVPGASGVSTADDMARFYATIAAGGAWNGVSVLERCTVEQMLAIEVDNTIDPTFNVPVRRGLGFEIGGLDDPRRHWPGSTSTAQTFWHGGFGSSVSWGERHSGVAMAFLTNGVRRDEAGAIARRDLSDAVRTIGGQHKYARHDD